MFSSNTSQVASTAANYIEDVFSTYLYTGTGATQTINNGIDLAGKGGMVWLKSRTNPPGTYDGWHRILDTNRGTNSVIYPNDTYNAEPINYVVNAFNSNGFSIGNGLFDENKSGFNYASWTFRKQPKFFDVVTWVGDGTSGRYINHSLSAQPNFIFSKCISSNGSWIADSLAWSNAFGGGNPNSDGALNSTAAFAYTGSVATWCWGSTSTQFYVGSAANVSGQTYVAYLFAHDAGGFGLTGTDNVISCGSFFNTATGLVNVAVGFEPQWILIKKVDSAQSWYVVDVMRGASLTNREVLVPNTSAAGFDDGGAPGWPVVNATGFQTRLGNSGNYIYIAIRRGPMKVPTDGTKVFAPVTRTGTGVNATVVSGQVTDAFLVKNRAIFADLFASRLTGTGYLVTSTTAAEVAAGATILQANPWDVMNGVKVGTTGSATNKSGETYVNYLFSRSPSFFDEVCYTGTGVARTLTHNLGVAPELMIIKNRTAIGDWFVYNSTLGATKYLRLNKDTGDLAYSEIFNNTSPTSSVFTVGTYADVNNSGSNLVAYLFATCAGVSKVGSYTGNGTSQTIPCGFAAGSRFVMIKRTDISGDWYVWDTARGIIAGNDPHISLNTDAAEVTTDDTIDPDSSGFIVNQVAATNVNVTAATYIFLAIA